MSVTRSRARSDFSILRMRSSACSKTINVIARRGGACRRQRRSVPTAQPMSSQRLSNHASIAAAMAMPSRSMEPYRRMVPIFLRTERDTGTEGVISRRLRNIKALGTRVYLAEMLTDPWRARRSSRETLDDAAQADDHFQGSDLPSARRSLTSGRRCLRTLRWTAPAWKDPLATEIVRRRFAQDRSTLFLPTAQGHDALDHLQEQVRAILHANDMDDVILVRSTASERLQRSDQDLHATGLDYLRRLSDKPDRARCTGDPPRPCSPSS